jgi:hypothetical protein
MRWLSQVSGLGRVSRVGRIEIGLALAALAVALVTSLALTVSIFAERQACYGVRLFKNPCVPVTPGVALRLTFVLLVVLALYAGALLAAWGQHRAQEPSARTTALMAMLTCAILLLAMTLSALDGPGFYLLPSLALLVVAVVVGIIAQVHGQPRAQSRNEASGGASTTQLDGPAADNQG